MPSNCLSTTPGPDTAVLLPPWRCRRGVDASEAFADLLNVVDSYPPGHEGIDGGGFQVQLSDSSKGYLYVEFESLAYGFIDDVEFFIRGNGDEEVQVRSASRVGTVDMGVNALRLNRIAADLRARGWEAPAITGRSHPDYVRRNQLADAHPYVIEGERAFGLPTSGPWAVEDD